MPRHVLITGASSGIGAALARAYAAPGRRLALWGRDPARLAAVAESAAARGAETTTLALDMADHAAVAAAVVATDDTLPLDLVIANAGISNAGLGGHADVASGIRVLTVNLLGVWATVTPAAERMRARGRGQLALMSSLAGDRGLPFGAAYGASKAGVRVMAESLRAELAPHGVKVSAICPGFVATPLTAKNRFTMPRLLDANDAAARIQRGLERNQPRIAFPRRLAWLSALAASLPSAAVDPWLRRRARPQERAAGPGD
ncbi:MAG: SDR family NAD(P)-dependent oxidoreductase [Geminicoccaceae bacterium]|nr:MAG: SDR family NAD(P)-dependent oxidoreductase [Geminicoccaceae bacterium]